MQPDAPLTEEEMQKIDTIQTEDGWTLFCSEVKKARAGRYPSDWYARVIVTGLINQVAARFGQTAEITIRSF